MTSLSKLKEIQNEYTVLAHDAEDIMDELVQNICDQYGWTFSSYWVDKFVDKHGRERDLPKRYTDALEVYEEMFGEYGMRLIEPKEK